MTRRFVLAHLVALFAAAACSGGGEGIGGDASPDVGDLMPEVDTLGPDYCTNHPGEPCDDEDPCTLGAGICLANVCFFEDDQKMECKNAPDECSVNGQCNGEGGCTWELGDGWCRIGPACVASGEKNPDNACFACLPEVNRGGWSPISGDSCTPADNPCTNKGKCQEGFCVAVSEGVDCASDFDCIAKDDGDLCNGIMVCKQCQCALDAASVVTCDTSTDTACAKTACIPESGTCTQTAVADGTACSDENPCTVGDACAAGLCEPGEKSPVVWTAPAVADLAYLTSVEVLPGTTPRLYAAGTGGVVYRSMDLGQTFIPSDLLASGSVPGDWLFVASTEPPVVLVIFGQDLFVSIDGGGAFEKKLGGCVALARAAASTQTYVAACSGQMWVSTDNGASWAGSGTLPVAGANVTALAASDQQVFFLGTRNEDAAGRGHVYKSVDAAQSWFGIDPPDRPDLAYVASHGLMVSAKAADKLFLGWASTTGLPFEVNQAPLFRSDDLGTTYTALNANTQGASFVPAALDSMGRLVLGVDGGVSRGGNYGNGPWGHIPDPAENTQIRMHTVTDVAIHPTSEFSFFIPAANGLALASDLGAAWTLLRKGLNGVTASNLAFCPDGTTVLAQDAASRAVLRSLDGGVTWSVAATPAASWKSDVTSLVCTGEDKTVLAFTADGGLLVSENGGQDFVWSDEGNGRVFGVNSAMSASKGAANRVFVARMGMGLARSEDGGLAQGKGFQPAGLPDGYVASVLADPFEANRVYAGTFTSAEYGAARVYLSTDGGTSFTSVLQVATKSNGTLPAGIFLTADPSVPGRVYATATGDSPAVYYTTDNGGSWAVLAQLPMASTRGLAEILPDQAVKGSAFVAFWMFPILHYDAVNKSWQVLDESPAGTTSLVYAPGSGKLLAASGLKSVVWESDDNGQTWGASKDFGQPDMFVRKLVAEEGMLFAILAGRSSDVGKLYVYDQGTWKESKIDARVSDVTVVYAAGGMALASGTFGGLFRSEDGGLNFAPYGTLDSTATDLLVSPSDPDVIYATVLCGSNPDWWDPAQTFLGPDCGVRRSMDGGQTWFTVLVQSVPCLSLAVVEELPNILVATCPGSGTHVTFDGGATWGKLPTDVGNPNVIKKLSQGSTAVFGQGMVFVGTYGQGVLQASVNVDNGSIVDWTDDMNIALKGVLPVARASLFVDPDSGSRLFVGQEPGGLLRSDNFGDTWNAADLGLFTDPDTAADPAAGPVMAAAYLKNANGEQELWVSVAARGLFKSKDHGSHYVYTSAADLSLAKTHPTALCGDPDHPGYSWLGTREGVWRTANSGETWQKLETGLAKGPVEALLCPVSANLYVSVAGQGLHVIPFDGAAFAKAHVLGFQGMAWPAWPGRALSTWSTALGDPGADEAALVAFDPYGFLFTQDGAGSFKTVASGLPLGRVTGLARHPEDSQLLVAGTVAGPYVSTDKGSTWAPAGENLASMGTCVSFAFDAEDLLAWYALCSTNLPHGLPQSGAESFGLRTLYRSKDGGATFAPSADGMLAQAIPVALLADPVAPGLLYVATASSGILKSEDYGISFDAWSTGLPSPATAAANRLIARPFALSPDGAGMLLGTDGFGIYFKALASVCEE